MIVRINDCSRFVPIHQLTASRSCTRCQSASPPTMKTGNLIRIEGDPQGVQEAKKELLELASRMVSSALALSVQNGEWFQAAVYMDKIYYNYPYNILCV